MNRRDHIIIKANGSGYGKHDPCRIIRKNLQGILPGNPSKGIPLAKHGGLHAVFVNPLMVLGGSRTGETPCDGMIGIAPDGQSLSRVVDFDDQAAAAITVSGADRFDFFHKNVFP